MADNHTASTLMRVPSEIRLSILDYLLPRNLDNKRTITFPIREHPNQPPDYCNKVFLHALETTPSRLSLRRYLSGISHVNRQLRLESLQLLYSYAFILEVSEHTFRPDGRDPHAILHYAETNPQWAWKNVLLCLDLTCVRELRLVIEPSDYPGFWPNVRNAMTTFPWPRGTTKCLRIEICEMQDSMAHNPPDFDCIVAWEPVVSTVEDVVDVLQVIGDRVKDVKRFELSLPEFVKGIEWFEEGIRALEVSVCEDRVWNELRDGDEEDPFDEEWECEDERIGDTERFEDGWPGFPGWDEPEAQNLWAKRELDEWDDFYVGVDFSHEGTPS